MAGGTEPLSPGKGDATLRARQSTGVRSMLDSDGAEELIVPAPAKLNLFLHVVGQRQDGYHLLESLMVLVGAGDVLRLRRRDDGVVKCLSEIAGVPAEEELGIRAARLLREYAGCSYGVDIDLNKKLPIGGGLGGGSSDAASILLALNRLWKLRLPRQELMQLGLKLGADVPFFIFGESALAKGIGDELTAVSVPRSYVVVLTPSVSVSTASIFSAPELTRHAVSARIPVFSKGYGHNDLQPIAVARFAEIAACVGSLERFGEARMTGSGACVFAMVPDKFSAQQALSRMPEGITGFVTRIVPRHPLWQFAAP